MAEGRSCDFSSCAIFCIGPSLSNERFCFSFFDRCMCSLPERAYCAVCFLTALVKVKLPTCWSGVTRQKEEDEAGANVLRATPHGSLIMTAKSAAPQRTSTPSGKMSASCFGEEMPLPARKVAVASTAAHPCGSSSRKRSARVFHSRNSRGGTGGCRISLLGKS